ncbi:hypothetical protein O7626_32055 [Micromonospora sp. WMMD1102]|uniref:hypothetical protein n=1 Tax=Micromonospora sp. WMMD1102 TaxID=3016105 RepID=UPI00241552AF|nr:hypothetical protein [Micromonospora sp. WMMD1102]MDG4790494.1 hypothetical protein [Micromonospora sp. WMMD1102]
MVTDGVPVNLVQRVMGHEQASTTLNRYTHTPDDYADRVRRTFADDLLTFEPPEAPRKRGGRRGTPAMTSVNALHPVKRRPPSGGDGGRLGFGSGGVEPNPPGGHGGCDRRGLPSTEDMKVCRNYKHA